MKQFRSSFTILELIIVMTITGILVGSTFQMFINIYKSYYEIYVMHSLDLDLLNASMMIVKNIENRVKGSLIDSNKTDFQVISGKYISDKNQTLQWIGIAQDSYLGTWKNSKSRVVANWNGFLDLNKNHNQTTIILNNLTNIPQAEDIIYNLSKSKVNISDKTSSLPAIFFKGGLDNSKTGFGWQNGESNNAFIGYFSNNSFITLGKFNKIYEQYFFSWTAYGLKVEDDRNLSLYWNYRPWNGETLEQHGEKITLLENVTEFRYGSNGTSILVEICIKDFSDITFCRENIIY